MLLLTLKPKQTINENLLAINAAGREGNAVSQNIGQIKETIKITLDLLADEWERNPRGVVALLKKHNK